MRIHQSIRKNIPPIVLGAFFIYFAFWLLVYKTNINNLAIQSEDTIPAMYLPYAILQDRTLYLDNYYNQMILRYPQPDDKDYVKGNTPFYLKKVDGHYLSAFPIITPIISLPVYFLPVMSGVPPTWDNLIILSHVSASLIVALSGWFLFLLIYKQMGITRGKSLLLTFIYLFCTVNFALISQALWQHGTLQLFTILALYFYYSYEKHKSLKYIIFCGLFFGLAVLSRPTALLAFACIYLLTIISSGKNIKSWLKISFAYFIGVLPVVLFFITYNGLYYQGISNQGYTSQLATSWVFNFPLSFIGVWLSPSKGILVYSPIILFSLFGSYISFKNKTISLNFRIFAIILLTHTLVISMWKHWYGGWSFGYRMSSDVIPYMVLMMIPFVESQYFVKYKKVFVIMVIVSCVIQLSGFIFYDGIWHAAYDKGFHNTSWLWSIKDSEFMFNLRRLLVKIGVISKACPSCL